MGEHAPVHLSIYTEPNLNGANQWGMAVDMNRASAATRAWWPARRRTTSRSSARTR